MHLDDELLMTIALDGLTPPAETATHLAICAECRDRLARWQQTGHDLALAKRSTPSPAALARYDELYRQVQRTPDLWQQAVRLIAKLVWDSRTQPAAAGVRAAGRVGYRLLYAAASQEVEIWVEPSAGGYTVAGEWMTEDDPAVRLEALVELTPLDTEAAGLTAESGHDGRFGLEGVPPGVYQLTLTPVHAAPVTIDRLEIG